MLAYAGRYGKQPISEARRMTISELCRFIEAVSKIVKDENRPARGSED